MHNVISVLIKQRQQVVSALGQHVALSLISILIAIVIAVPLAIVLRRHKHLAEFCLQITGIFQTIPSLALLGLLIPFVGIGTTPSIIALVVYAIMPIFQDAYSGLTSIDNSLEEAGHAFGLSYWQRLWIYELPLAMPMIVSGIRIATVLVIGTATLAALIGAGGLGTYILLGIETNNNSLLIIGAVLSALLALVFSGVIKLISKPSLKKMVIALITLLVIICGGLGYHAYSSAQQAKNVVIAGKLGSEPDILIHMYKDLIHQQDPHQKITVKPNFGTTEFLINSLKSNRINIYPEFTGTVLESITKQPQLINRDPKVTYRIARDGLKRDFDMSYLKPMHYQNGYTLAVRKSFAEKYHLHTISDLKRIAPKLHAGFDPDFAKQRDGYPGVSKNYDLKFKYKTMSPAIRYKAIANDRVNIVDGYTTDPQIRQYHLQPLRDNHKFFPPYQGAPLMKQSFLSRHRSIKKALEKLSGHITDRQMQEMNYLVTIKHESAGKVARHYLLVHGLIKK